MKSEHDKIESLLNPESIAVVGASPDSRYSGNLIRNLLDYGFEGSFYPVNPNREEVFGEKSYDSLSDLPEIPDMVVISLPRDLVLQIVEEAGEIGVDSLLIITAGFSESDEEGEELEKELEKRIEEYDMAVCGPNTIGFANATENIVPSAICSRKPEDGSIALLSQSGALAFATFFDRAKDNDVEFSKIIATGNETGLTMSDYIGYLAEDPESQVIAAYLEGVENPRRFVNSCIKARKNGKQVLVVKTGDSDKASQTSQAHTGAISGSKENWEAAFKRAGVEKVEDIPDLLERSKAAAVTDPEDPSICITSTSGGLAGLLADMADARDLELPEIDGETEQKLLDMDELLTFGEMYNPADIRQQGTEAYLDIAKILFDDEKYNAYVFAVALPAVGEQAEEIAEKMIEIEEMSEDPVIFLWTGRKETDKEVPAYQRIRKKGLLYYDASKCMDAVKTSLNPPTIGETVEDRKNVDPQKSELLNWEDSLELVNGAIDVVNHKVVESLDEARKFAEENGYPVVVKSAGSEAHKTELNAVSTDVTAESLSEEFSEVKKNSESSKVLVQEQVSGSEILVGSTYDKLFGHTVTVAPGGTATEALKDHQITFLAPISPEEVYRRLEGSVVEEIVNDRNSQDFESLVEIVSRVSNLVREERLASLEINPVVVTEDGSVAVDLLVEK